MNSLVISIVIGSTFTHAYWNYVLKKVQGGVVFVWLFTVLTTLLYMPLIVLNWDELRIALDNALILYCLMSVSFHLFYFLTLDQAYRYGELSIIYPVARGVAPIFTIIVAGVLFKEHLTWLQLISISAIIIGAFFLSDLRFSVSKKTNSSLGYALLCSLMVAGYTIVDKAVVSIFFLSPFVLDFINNLGRSLALMPIALKNKHTLGYLLKHNFKEGLIIAVLSPLSYLLVLFAMRVAPISIIAPLRQFSIVASGILGVKLLYESMTKNKVIGLCLMLVGLVLICIV